MLQMNQIKKLLMLGFGMAVSLVGLEGLSAGDFADRPGPRDDRIEHYERRRAAEEAARQRAQAEAEARERERVANENRRILAEITERIAKEHSDIQTEINRRIDELDAEWVKRYESIETEIFRQDFQDSLKFELEDYVKEIAGQADLTERISDGQRRDRVAHAQSDFSFSAHIQINTEGLMSVGNQGSPLSEVQLRQFEADCRKAHHQALIELLVARSSILQQIWSRSLANLTQTTRKNSEVEQMMQALKATARQVIQKRRQEIRL
jgi:hypothetical protein